MPTLQHPLAGLCSAAPTDPHCDRLGSGHGAPGNAQDVAAAVITADGGQSAEAAAPARSCGDSCTATEQAAVHAEVAAAAHDALIAQCQALLSMEDPACLPHDPLFDLLPPPGASRLRRRAPSKADVAAMMAAVADEADALCHAGANGAAALLAETTLAATLLRMAPSTGCHRRADVATAPSPAQLAHGEQGQVQQQEWQHPPSLCFQAVDDVQDAQVGNAGGDVGMQSAPQSPSVQRAARGAEEPAADTPSGKRRRLSGAAGEYVAVGGDGGKDGTGAGAGTGTPFSGASSCGQLSPGACTAEYGGVAREISLSPSPTASPSRRLQMGSPHPASSACKSRGPAPAAAGAAGGKPAATSGGASRGTMVLRPFNLFKSPRTVASIDELNARINASATQLHQDLCKRAAATAAAVTAAPRLGSKPERVAIRATCMC